MSEGDETSSKSARLVFDGIQLTRLHRDGRKRTMRLIVGKSHRERMKYRGVADGERKTEKTGRQADHRL